MSRELFDRRYIDQMKLKEPLPAVALKVQRDLQTSIEADLSEVYRKSRAEPERPSGFREEQTAFGRENSRADQED